MLRTTNGIDVVPFRGIPKISLHPSLTYVAKAFCAQLVNAAGSHVLQDVFTVEAYLSKDDGEYCWGAQGQSYIQVLPHSVHAIDWLVSENAINLCTSFLMGADQHSSLQMSTLSGFFSCCYNHKVKSGPLWSFKCSPHDSNCIALGTGKDCKISVLDIFHDKEQNFAIADSDIFSIAYSMEIGSSHLVAGKRNGKLCLYDTRAQSWKQASLAIGRMNSSIDHLHLPSKSAFYVISSDWSGGLSVFDTRKSGLPIVEYRQSNPKRYKQIGAFGFQEELSVVMISSLEHSAVNLWDFNTGVLINTVVPPVQDNSLMHTFQVCGKLQKQNDLYCFSSITNEAYEI